MEGTIKLIQKTLWVRYATVIGALGTSLWIIVLYFYTKGVAAAAGSLVCMIIIRWFGYSPLFALNASLLCFHFDAVGIWLPIISYILAPIMLYVDLKGDKLRKIIGL